jgi:hypothetical protein
MTNEPTIKFYAMDVATAEAELGLLPSDRADKFMIVEFWVEGDQYEFGGGVKDRAAIDALIAAEPYIIWY